MDREQEKVLNKFGYVFAEVEGLLREPRATFYRIINGGIMECPNLPADAMSLQRYLSKGFKLTREELLSQSVEKSQEEFICQDCGESFTKRIALAGHSRKHKNTVGGKKKI